MTIDELLAAIGLTANDEIPLWDAEATVEEPTKKITATNFAAAVKALASLIATTDVKDVLNSTSATDPLSANQGKVLNDRASAISDDITAAYDPASTYDLGDLCIYNNTLYRCTTAITTAEAWTAAHWTATTVEAELAGKLTPDDVVNNLTSTETTKVLSAAQGKVLAGESGTGYVKLYGGILIQWGKTETTSVSGNSQKDIAVYYPKTFVDTPIVVGNTTGGSFTPRLELTGPNITYVSTINTTFRVRNDYSSALNVNILWLAIGRWEA